MGCKENNNYASSTVYGQITGINGTKITMLLGDFSDNNMNNPQMPNDGITGNMPGEMPNENIMEGMKNNFAVGTVKLTIDVSSAQIQSVDGTIDLKVQDIIKVVFDADENPKTIELMNNNVLVNFIEKNFNHGTATVTITENVYINTLENLGTINYNGYTIILSDGIVLK